MTGHPGWRPTSATHGGIYDQPWRTKAACRDTDPALFDPHEFAYNGGIEPMPAYRKRLTEAIALCTRCPVLADCFTYAKTRDAWGIWAGQVWEHGRIKTSHGVNR